MPPAGPALIQPYVLLGYDDDPALQRRCAENYVRRTVPPRAALAGKRYSHDRIRLAYLSPISISIPPPSFWPNCSSVTTATRFEVTAVSFGPDDGSAMRARLKQAFDHFEDVRRRSDAEVAQWLTARETDIAVDLNGHTHGARTGIFAHRPAPVQVNYLVYPGTMGAPFMDYILADRIVLPDQQPFFSEKIVHLPDCYQANDARACCCRRPPRRRPACRPKALSSAASTMAGRSPAGFRNLDAAAGRRLKAACSGCWTGPDAGNLRREAARAVSRRHALVFAPKLPPDQHLARHQLADLFLDTLPYNAHTSCSDALWAGLPVITCYGKAFPGRVAASLLESDRSARAGHHPAGRLRSPGAGSGVKIPPCSQATKQKLLRNRRTTPLYDSERFRQNIEAAYEKMLA